MALAIAAHPDDVEFNCGGTLAKWSAAGCVVHHLILTDGSKGSWDPEQDLEALVALRQEEQRSAARALGATGDVVLLGWVDGELDVTPGAPRRRRLLDPPRPAGRRARPRPLEALPAPPRPPPRPASWPPTASSPRGTPTSSPNTTSTPAPDALLLFEADEPDHVEDVTDWTDPKLAGVECHESQFETTMFKDLGEVESAREAFRARERQKMVEMGEVASFRYGETFTRVSDL